MDKFSELSHNARKAVNSFYNWSQLASCTSERVSCLTAKQLKETSELLSALLVELEVKSLECMGIEQERGLFRVERAAHQQYAQDLEQRVADLSELETHNECLLKKNADLTLQNIKLGERLATPVRLPVVLMGYQSDDYRIGFMEGVEKSGDEVRAAGFTVEGDE